MSVRIIVADVFDGLRQLPDDSVHCVCTSPPYWGLRDYGTAEWEGGDPDCRHINPTKNAAPSAKSTLTTNAGKGPLPGDKYHHDSGKVQFRESCKHCGAIRVDRQIGLEPTLGEHLAVMVDVFREVRRVLRPDGTVWLNYGDCYATKPNGRSAADTKAAGNDDRTFRDKPFSTVGPIHAPTSKDPFRKDKSRRGGGLNSDPMLKEKDLCMVPNRLAIALQEDGWWVRSEIVWAKPNPMPESVTDRPTSSHEKIYLLAKSPRYYYDAEAVREDATHAGKTISLGEKSMSRGQAAGAGVKPSGNGLASEYVVAAGRNLRNVWTITTRGFSEAHFATFPPALAETCIKAGCPEGGTVLDTFGGAGTTGLVADRLGRDAILIELNPEYAEMARARIEGDAGMFAEVAAE